MKCVVCDKEVKEGESYSPDEPLCFGCYVDEQSYEDVDGGSKSFNCK